MADTGSEKQPGCDLVGPVVNWWSRDSGQRSAEPVFIPLTRWREEYVRLAREQQEGSVSNLTLALVLEGFGAFVGLKVIGPMAEAFAAKLGESLGETALAASRRILLRFKKERAETMIKLDAMIVTATGAVTTVVLPDSLTNDSFAAVLKDLPLTDEALLALIDLDVTADGVRGETLRWDPKTKTWGTRRSLSGGYTRRRISGQRFADPGQRLDRLTCGWDSESPLRSVEFRFQVASEVLRRVVPDALRSVIVEP